MRETVDSWALIAMSFGALFMMFAMLLFKVR